MRALAAQVELHTDLLHNLGDDLNAEQSRVRVANTNSVAFLVTHLVHARVYLLGLLGQEYPNPLPSRLESVSADGPELELPPMSDLLCWWDECGHALAQCLRQLSESALEIPVETRFPTEDRSLAGAVLFLVAHEGYHLGQIGLLRRQLGKAPMSYARRTPKDR